VKQILNATFPDYKGRAFKLNVVDETRSFSLNSMWDGGSRDYYAIIELATMKAVNISEMVGNYRRPDQRISLREGFALVERSYFCGKDMGLTIYILTNNAAKMIPSPVEVTEIERKVLNHGRRMKAESGLSSQAWDMTENALMVKGLLTRSGVLTLAGKNYRSAQSGY